MSDRDVKTSQLSIKDITQSVRAKRIMRDGSGALNQSEHTETFTLSWTANSSMSVQFVNQMHITVNFDGLIRVLIS